MDYGRGITEIREALGMNMREFAERVNSTAGTVFKFEGNYEKITKEDAEAFCKALNLPMEMYYFLCLDPNDLTDHKKYLFEMLGEEMRDALKAYFIPQLEAGVDMKKEIDSNGRMLMDKIADKIKVILNENVGD